MRVTGDWLESADTQAVLKMLTDGGYEAYGVGGCVRNALLGVPVADVDIATNAKPETVVALAEAAGLKPVPTGAEHGTITVIANGVPHEVTTYRNDVETFGRHAVIAYSDDIHEDARRRDFTVNALYVAADGTLVDPLGGYQDIAKRRIRFIEDPSRRIEEDYLRILRFFRFFAWYGDPDEGIDREGLAACAKHIAGIPRLSKERIGAEMKKLLAAPDPSMALAAMEKSGVLGQTLSGADPRFIGPLVEIEGTCQAAPDWHRRLAALGGEYPEKAFRLSRAETRRLASTLETIEKGGAAAVRAYRYGIDIARDAILVEASMMQSLPEPDFESALAKGAKAVFPVKAEDLMPALAPGPELGRELRRLEDLWLESDFALSREALLAKSRS